MEAQCGRQAGRKNRILYSWAQTYDRSIKSGEHYLDLKPSIAIWLLDEVLFAETDKVHLKLEICARDPDIISSNQLTIHVLQLKKLKEDFILKTDREPLLYLFVYGAGMDLDCLPAPLDTPIFNKVLNIMRTFTQTEQDKELYEGCLIANAEYRYLQNAAQQERKQRILQKNSFDPERQQLLAANEKDRLGFPIFGARAIPTDGWIKKPAFSCAQDTYPIPPKTDYSSIESCCRVSPVYSSLDDQST